MNHQRRLRRLPLVIVAGPPGSGAGRLMRETAGECCGELGRTFDLLAEHAVFLRRFPLHELGPLASAQVPVHLSFVFTAHLASELVADPAALEELAAALGDPLTPLARFGSLRSVTFVLTMCDRLPGVGDALAAMPRNPARWWAAGMRSGPPDDADASLPDSARVTLGGLLRPLAHRVLSRLGQSGSALPRAAYYSGLASRNPTIARSNRGLLTICRDPGCLANIEL